MNISADETYQLSLYIQNDPNIEQKSDSKVTIQCSSQVTKNIIFEQSLLSDYSRKMDQRHISSRNQSIVPVAQLVVKPAGGKINDNSNNITEMVASHMDVLKGRLPYLKIIDGSVELGDDVTLIIRTKKNGIARFLPASIKLIVSLLYPDDYDSQISQCFAYDDGHANRFELTNTSG